MDTHEGSYSLRFSHTIELSSTNPAQQSYLLTIPPDIQKAHPARNILLLNHHKHRHIEADFTQIASSHCASRAITTTPHTTLLLCKVPCLGGRSSPSRDPLDEIRIFKSGKSPQFSPPVVTLDAHYEAPIHEFGTVPRVPLSFSHG